MPIAFAVDTNILLYSVSRDPLDRLKTAQARELLARNNWGISAQSLAEFYVGCRRLAHPLSITAATEFLQNMRTRPIAQVDFDLVVHAIKLHERFQISYWDAAILAAAHELEAPLLYTEDLNHGQFYDAVQVINPFRVLAP